MSQAPLVLVADNDPDVSAMLAEVLHLHGARVEVVADGGAAIDRLREGDVDLLVCDLDMPNVDGEGVVQALPGLRSPPPVVIVTGFVEDATVARLQASPHVCRVMIKPFDVIEFARQACAIAQQHAGARAASLAASSDG
ncbi:MAG TPA: response regulator [Planctomycetota bacterium]|nr:response regulator [Planctomycetota bacterium]